MTDLDLHTNDPALLADRATPAQLAAAIHRLHEWDEPALATADLLIAVWSARAIARPNDREGIAELQRLIQRALAEGATGCTPPPEYAHRWQAIGDLLQARWLNLAHANPEAQLRRRHVPEVLAFLDRADGEAMQSALLEYLGVSAGRITQILGPLEGHGLIERQRKGRDNILRLTALGKQLVPATPNHGVAKRGASYLTQAA